MIGFLALLLCAGMAHGEEDVVAAVDARAGEFAAVAQAIWEHAELGYLEERSSALLQWLVCRRMWSSASLIYLLYRARAECAGHRHSDE